MASTMIPILAVGIQACASTGNRKRSSTTSWWWTPLFGWSSEPDYINSNNKGPKPQRDMSESDLPSKPSRPRFAGGLTEEKARQLRIMTVGTETFHDTMYHSAIASRLASEFNARSDL